MPPFQMRTTCTWRACWRRWASCWHMPSGGPSHRCADLLCWRLRLLKVKATDCYGPAQAHTSLPACLRAESTRSLTPPSPPCLLQWAICGETYPVGCRFHPAVRHSQYFSANPDRRKRLYSSPTGALV